MKFSTKYDRHESKGFSSDLPTRTMQSMKDECDINLILKRYKSTGILPDLIRQNPQFGDFTEVTDYQSSMEVVLKANAQFDALSAEVRERFHNDPAKFLEFCNNKQNGEEMVRLGLAIPRPVTDENKPVSVETKPIPKTDHKE